MADSKKEDPVDTTALHQHYMDILNALPNIVYWVDNDCLLKGCNHQFVKLFGLQQMRDLLGSPYEKMIQHAHWPNKRVEAFKFDDMQAIFTGKPRYEVEEAPVKVNDQLIYYRSTRVPLLDKSKRIVGLVVSLMDITEQKQSEDKRSGQGIKKIKTEKPSEQNKVPQVLVVEDNLIAQKVEKALFVELNCRVDIAESGEKAMELFTPGKYDIIFMDLGLEDTSGYLVTKKLRKMEENTAYHAPIIALTSYQADRVKHDCRDYSMEGVISKPLTSDQAQQLLQHFVYHEDVAVTGLLTD